MDSAGRMNGEPFDYRGATRKMLERAKLLTEKVEALLNEFSEETGLPVFRFDIGSVNHVQGVAPGNGGYRVKAHLGLPSLPEAANDSSAGKS